jgi:hypothetical protein
MNRRSFSKRLIAFAAGASSPTRDLLRLDAAPMPPGSAGAPPASEGFPAGSYTPFGYLDNPHHTWDLHQSGVLRSVPPVGFGIYFPAGPGGYFDFRHNSIYQVTLRLGFRLNGRVLYNEADFANAGVQISSSYHSKNIVAFHFAISDSSVEAAFFQNSEDVLASLVHRTISYL